MRKALIAVIVASALFAVGAFAAELTVNSDDVASGEGDVVSCASSADLTEWDTTEAVSPTSGADTDWQAEGATIVLTEADGRSCDGAHVDIAIGTDTGTDDIADTWTDGSCSAGTDLTYTCTWTTPIDVRPIVEVAVLVDGNTLPLPVPA